MLLLHHATDWNLKPFNDMYLDPTKATSNQKAIPWISPVCDNLNTKGMSSLYFENKYKLFNESWLLTENVKVQMYTSYIVTALFT